MKGFTIRLPKQNIDPQGSLKNRILNEVKNRLPFAKWYGIHTPEDPEYSISYAGPEDLLCFGCNRNAHFSAFNKNIIDRHVHMIIHLHVRSQIEHLSCVNMMLFQNLI